ncbi:hypothetical protein D9757_002584 [Collybiopsis confluens]|uniref:F-box domain-containing protein n=1 Tax=Collybiopsis confluens TaxID=2823264 RepID=A0A8H5HWI1_9AGAR|nr:hypothetical protein D9757_002584 [Collybiopsis confluens]
MSSKFLPLPTELLTQIFALTATSDSGVTLRSLLRVSRLFHDICVPLKFHCVTLTSSLDIQHFHRELEHLEHAPVHLRRIFHLFISLNPSDIDTDTECDAMTKIFLILHTAADTLQSLTFICHNPLFSTSVFGRLFRQSFPVLTELTIHGFYPFPNTIPSREYSSPGLPSREVGTSYMPMLERLHLSGNRNPYGLLQLSSLDECFPSLTHLRVSGLLMAGSFVEEMKGALEEHSALLSEDHITTPPKLPARLPSLLQSLILQPGFIIFPERSNAASSISKKHLRMMERLKEIDDEAAKCRQGIRVTLKNCMHDPGAVGIGSELHSDWLSRMNGAEGCW